MDEPYRVVLADDEMVSRGYMELFIKPSKHYEIAATLPFAQDVIDWCGKNPLPDLIILDVMMETGIDGLTAAGQIKRAVQKTLDAEGIREPCLISVMLTDGEGIRTVNREFRGVDRETDVLSFPANEFEAGKFDVEKCEFDYSSGKYYLGDIVISVPKCALQSREYGHSVYREVKYLAVHSMLHLLGYDHERSEEEEKEMFGKQEIVLSAMGLER